MSFDNMREQARQTVNDLSRYAAEHAELARDQYEDYTDRHGDPVERAREQAREPIEQTQRRILELSEDVNDRTQKLALEVTEQTDALTRTINAEAERVTQEVVDRMQPVRELVEAARPRQVVRTEEVREPGSGKAGGESGSPKAEPTADAESKDAGQQPPVPEETAGPEDAAEQAEDSSASKDESEEEDR